MAQNSYEALLKEARARATQSAVPRWGADTAFEDFRTRCQRFFAEVPEPPVYLRSEDPLRARAEEMKARGVALLSEGLVFSREAETKSQAAKWVAALEGSLKVMVHLAAGRLREAEEAFEKARGLETEALKSRQMWARPEEDRKPAYDKQTGASRYDPRVEPLTSVKLACPNPACRIVGTFAFDSSASSHRFTCATCTVPFVAFFAETRKMEVASERGGKHYHFEVDDVGGGASQIDFDDGSGLEFAASRRDLLAFLYTEGRELKGVLNLSNGRALWVQRFGPCFLVSVAFGSDAPELSAFRAYRDDVLLRDPAGRLFVRAYYLSGPTLARVVKAFPRLHRMTRAMLSEVHLWLISPK